MITHTSPVGSVIAFSGDLTNQQTEMHLASLGWMLCDGRSLIIREYFDLYEVIGTSYGGSDSLFNLPDYSELSLKSSNKNIPDPPDAHYIIRYK